MSEFIKVLSPIKSNLLGEDLDISLVILIATIYQVSQIDGIESVYCNLDVLDSCHDLIYLFVENLDDLVNEQK